MCFALHHIQRFIPHLRVPKFTTSRNGSAMLARIYCLVCILVTIRPLEWLPASTKGLQPR